MPLKQNKGFGNISREFAPRLLIHQNISIMRTLRTIKKKLKTATQKRNAFLGRTINMYNYEDIILTKIGRYNYQVER